MKDFSLGTLLYHFCRLQLPAVTLPIPVFEKHLHRTFEVHCAKAPGISWPMYLETLYAVDWFLCAGCLEGQARAWEALFAARASRADCLFVDALRARAVRLYPRNEERQENADAEFWSHLLVSETPGSVPILARYDGQRPLIPWLIRVFQNWHISMLRQHPGPQSLPEEDLALPLPAQSESRWHEAFRLAAREYIGKLTDNELLILGLRLRYRMSQREVAGALGIHEGNVSRQTTHLRDRFLAYIGERLMQLGWTGDDLSDLVLQEMGSLLLDDPRLSAEKLRSLLERKGKRLPR